MEPKNFKDWLSKDIGKRGEITLSACLTVIILVLLFMVGSNLYAPSVEGAVPGSGAIQSVCPECGLSYTGTHNCSGNRNCKSGYHTYTYETCSLCGQNISKTCIYCGYSATLSHTCTGGIIEITDDNRPTQTTICSLHGGAFDIMCPACGGMYCRICKPNGHGCSETMNCKFGIHTYSYTYCSICGKATSEVCTLCGYSQTLSHTCTGRCTNGHTYGAWTAIDEISHKRICTKCGSDQIGSHEGNWGEVKQGRRQCKLCSWFEFVEVEKPKHTVHNYTASYSSISSWYHQSVCSCGETKTESHIWDYQICVACGKGNVAKYCTKCRYSENIAHTCTTTVVHTNSDEHTWSGWSKISSLMHSRTCTVCGVIHSANHNFKDGKICTCGKAITKKCEDCGYSYDTGHEKCSTTPDTTIPDTTTPDTTTPGTTTPETTPQAHKCTTPETYSTNEEYHWKVCPVCSEFVVPKTPHADTDGDKKCDTCGYEMGTGEHSEPEKTEDEFILEDDKYVVNSEVSQLAVELRTHTDMLKANRNIFGLNEEITYYIDYINGGDDITDPVTIKFDLPLESEIIDAGGSVDGIKASGYAKTVNWEFPEGLKHGEGGTKVIKVKYISLSKSSLKYELVQPRVRIFQENRQKDVCSVINLIYKDMETVIKVEHEPYMKGYDDGTFKPNGNITRAEAALVLSRIFKLTVSNNYKADFNDMAETYDEAQDAISALQIKKLLQGYGDGSFRPKQAITRGEFMAVLARYISEQFEDSEGLKLRTAENSILLCRETSDYWGSYEVTLMVRLNLINLDDDVVRAGENITRAEVTQLVNLYLYRAPVASVGTNDIKFTDLTTQHSLITDIVEATRDAHSYRFSVEGTELE